MNRSIERHRNIADFALSSLLRRKVKNISLLVLYALIVFVLASVVFFTQSLKREAAMLLKDAPDMVVQKMVAGRHDLIPTSYGTKITAIRGVREVQPRLWGYYYDPSIGANYTLLVPGNQPPAPRAVSIGSGIARIRRLTDGDMMALRAYNRATLLFQVEGILPAETELATADLILMGEDDFRALFDFPRGVATDLAVTVANPKELTTVARKIVDQFPDTRPILKSEILRTYDAIFDWRGGMMVVLLAAAVLSFIIFAWDKATGLSAEERKEIGILKSIGWETSDVLLLKFWEGTAISLSAFLLGVILAYGHVFFFSATLFEHALKGWGVLYPRFRLVPSFDLYQIAMLFFLTVLPYTAATIIPAWRAATVDPDAAMRS
jgi:ABC-type lipoprotein release transport system permease subunit